MVRVSTTGTLSTDDFGHDANSTNAQEVNNG